MSSPTNIIRSFEYPEKVTNSFFY